MMTTFRDMRRPFLCKALIIGVLALALAGCSAVRLGYDNGNRLARWWLDDWLDLRGDQTAVLEPALETWFAWHRRQELPEYADALAALAQRAGGGVSGDEICRWNDEWRERLERAVEQALPTAAAMLPGVDPRQWAFFARKLADKQAELRAEIAPPDPAERARGQFERSLDRAESFYGKLDAPQRKLLATMLAESPFDAPRWLDEREARQADFLRRVKELQAAGVSPAHRVAGLREGFQRLLWAKAPEARARQQRLAQANCELSARLHNATHPRQREYLRQRLKAWEEDLRALAAAPVRAPKAENF